MQGGKTGRRETFSDEAENRAFSIEDTGDFQFLTKPNKVVLLFSGGLDSTVLLSLLLAHNVEVHALSFKYGSKHNAREGEAAAQIAQLLGVPRTLIRLPFIGELFHSALLQSGDDIPQGHYTDESMRKTVVPFRNGILLSIATGYAESIEASAVFYGAHAGDHTIYPDCRPTFLAAMQVAALLGTDGKVELQAPFLNDTKRDIALLGRELNAPLSSTWTCYEGRAFHCGKCGACTERREALAGFDGTEYE